MARNDNDDSALLRVINVPARGIGKGSVDKLSTWAAEARSSIWSALEKRIDDLPPRAKEGARALVGIVNTIRELAKSEGMARALDWLVEETGYRHHLRQTVDDPLELDMRLGVVDDLVDTARTLGASGQSSLDAFLDSLALRDREQEKSDDGSPAITLLTMHAAKGLEFKVAFIVGMEEGTLPHQKSIASEDDDRPDSDAIEEERRLAYVGFTRARERLILSYARERTRYGRTEKQTMSRFLEEAGSDAFYVTDSADATPADPEMGKEMMRQIRARLGSEGSGGSRPPWWEETEG